ncbi:cytochrome P450 [Leifsonia sp. 22587]|uniref:cytochrome P450 n=1 Tax=Leifsonia sp. 22587 TaxID=3453946 RepID=UPI003F840210
MMKALHAQDMSAVAESAFRELTGRIDSTPSGTTFDLIDAALAPAAMRLVTEALGVAGFDPSYYLRISERLTKAMDSGIDPARLGPGMAAGAELRGAVREWFGTPSRMGMMSTLADDVVLQAELARKGEGYLRNTVGGIFNAAFGTSLAVAAALVELTLARPGAVEAAAAAPDPVVAANELLRYLSPAQGTSRIAVEDVEVAGASVRRGDSIITLIASANRDERHFRNPDELEFDRSPNAHLAFAWGPHVCLGAQLATHWVVRLVRDHEFWLDRLLVDEIVPLDSATLRSNTMISVRKK